MNETLHSLGEEVSKNPLEAAIVEMIASKRKWKNPPCLSTPPMTKSVRLSKGNRVTKAFIPIVNLDSFDLVKKSSSEGNF